MTANQSVALVLMSIGWAGGWIASKVAAVNAPPLTVSSVRFLIAGLLLLAVVRLTGDRMPRSHWRELFMMSLTGIAGYGSLVFVGLQVSTAADAGVITTGMTPVLSALLAAIFAGETLDRWKTLGFILSVGGVVVMMLEGTSMSDNPARLIADLLIVMGALGWASYTVIAKTVLRVASPLVVTASTTTLGGIMLVPLALLEGGFTSIPTWSLDAWAAVLYLIGISTMIGIWFFCSLVIRQGATQAATALFLVPVGTLVLSSAILGEDVGPRQLLGASLAISGVWFALIRRGPSAPLGRRLQDS